MNKILLFFIFMFGGTLLYSQNIVIDGVIFSADGKTLIKCKPPIKYPYKKESL